MPSKERSVSLGLNAPKMGYQPLLRSLSNFLYFYGVYGTFEGLGAIPTGNHGIFVSE